MTARFVIVRHGNTFAPAETPRRIGARTDLPLVESGRAQARRLGEWFVAQGVRFDRVLTSRLRRARETAETILAAQAAPPTIELSDFLAEIDHGVDENRPEAEVVGRLGVEALALWDRKGVAPDGWIVNEGARVSAWADFLVDDGFSTTLLVTSNGAARFALLANPSLRGQAACLPSFKLRTGAFGMIAVESGVPRLTVWDQRP